jgi:hypothetical protein
MNANGLRVALYGVAALVALVAWWREWRPVGPSDRRADWWPAFWLMTAAVLGAMALGRVLDLDAITSLARNEAIVDGWYENRRRLQVVVVGGVGAFWGISVLAALWRVPERRRRYLPTAIVVFSLLCYAAVRLVSLHHVDALLYRRGVRGVRFGALVEIAMILAAIALPLLVTRGQARSRAVAAPAR